MAPAQPWNTINAILLSASIPQQPVFVGQGPARLAITSLTLGVTASAAGSVVLDVQVYLSNTAGGDCATLTGATFGTADRVPVVVPVGQSITMTWPTPLVLSRLAATGKRFCVNLHSLSGPAGYQVYGSASGYTY